MSPKSFIVLITLALFLPFAVGCRQGSRQKGKPLVVATTTFAGEVARTVCRQDCEVAQIMGPGIDPHLYKATLRDAELLYKADVIVVNGLHLEGKMAEILHDIQDEKPIIVLSDGLREDQLIGGFGGSSNVHDPHFWFDAGLFAQGARHCADAMGKTGFVHPDSARVRIEPYVSQILKLQAYAKQTFALIPAERRILATTHDAFSYMGKAYGIEIKSLQGISTLSEFSVRDVSRLAQFLSDRKVSAMFPETSTPKRSVQAVVQACAQRGHTLRIGPPLFTDALGPNGTLQQTYPGMYRSNVDTIVQYLK